jgi:hypothetical protein
MKHISSSTFTRNVWKQGESSLTLYPNKGIMKLLHNRALVLVDPNAKSNKKINTPFGEIDLYIGSDYSWDGRISNSTSGILLHDFKEAPKGSVVIFNHRATTQDNEIDDKIFLIDDAFIYFYLDNGQPVPFNGYFLISRIAKKKYTSELVHIPDGWNDTYYDNIFTIEKTPRGNDTFHKGQQVIAYKFSDYEIPYAVEGTHSNVIRLKEDDILAINYEQI